MLRLSLGGLDMQTQTQGVYESVAVATGSNHE